MLDWPYSSNTANFHNIRGEFHGDRPPLPEAAPAGYSSPNAILAAMSESESSALYTLAESILQNPEQVRQLGDRVYELLQNDMRYQRDRNGSLRR